MTTADAVVVGGGVVGASAFFLLCALGLGRVILCERRQAGAGASGASGAFIQLHFCRNEAEARLTQESLRYFHHWDDLVGAGTCGFSPVGYLRLEPPDRAGTLRDRVAMLAALGGNTSVITPHDVAELAPYPRTDDIAAAAYEPESGYADAIGTVGGLLETGQRRGGAVFTDTAVSQVIARNGVVTGGETTEGRLDTPLVVLAAGAWSLPLPRQTGLDLPVRVSLTQWIGFDWEDGRTHSTMTVGDGALGSYFRHDGERRERVLVGLGGGLEERSMTLTINQLFRTLPSAKHTVASSDGWLAHRRSTPAVETPARSP